MNQQEIGQCPGCGARGDASGCAGCGGCGAKQASGGCPGCAGGRVRTIPPLNQAEAALLSRLQAVLYLPLAQFWLVPKGAEYEDGMLILSPVLLEKPEDTLDEVMERAEVLISLAQKELVTLDYDLPMTNYGYEEYYCSALFREFTTDFSQRSEGRPVLRRGSVAIAEWVLEEE